MTDEDKVKLDEIHRALFTPLPGDDKPFIVRMQVMSRDWARMGWGIRTMAVLAMTASGIIVAWENIITWLKKLVS